MKKILSLNKFFIAFCIFFILVWIALQTVSSMRLKSMAKIDSDRILAWIWPNKNIKSTIKIYETKILKKEHNDAIVKVLADQSIEPIVTQEMGAKSPESFTQNSEEGQLKSSSKCAVTLTYYRTNNLWFLGKVELE
jgi:hypothetical protein